MKSLKMLSVIAMLLIVFVSGCKKDEDPGLRPTVLSTDPIADATNYAVNKKVSVIFSAPMDAATMTTSTFTLQKAGVNVEGTVTSSGSTATFSPTANLTANTLYKATVTTGAKDLEGKSL